MDRYPVHLLRAADLPESGVSDNVLHSGMGAAHEPADDRDDCLRVTALEMAVKHCPHGAADDVARAAEKFRTFLAGPEPDTSGDRLGYASMGAERIDMGGRPWGL